MEFSEWVAKYEKKTGDKFVADSRYELFFLPDKGFCEVTESKNMVVIRCLCGDVAFWRNFVNQLAVKLGKPMCGTRCIRKEIKAYIRLMGYKITLKQVLPDGKSRYEGIRSDGKRGWMSPYTEVSGKEGYFVTWEP